MEPKTKNNSCKIIADFLNAFCFGAFPNRIISLMGKEAARGVLRDTSIEVIENVLSEKKSSIRKMLKNKSLGEKFKFCYLILEKFFPFQCSLKYVGEKEDDFVLIVTKCPHIEYTKNNPIACWVCAGMKIGVLKVAGIKDPIRRFSVDNKLPYGGKRCTFRIKKQVD